MLPRTAATLLLALAIGATPAPDFENPSTPPPGIIPATLSQRAVLERYAQARAESVPWKTRVTHYILAAGGLAGTRDEVARGADYRVSIAEGPFTSSYGGIAGRDWSRDENGEVVDVQNVDRRDIVDERVLENPLRHPHDISLLGRALEPVDAYVLRIDPAGGRLEYVFLDARSFSIDRIEASVEGRRYVTTYDDFRSTQGHLDAWHVLSEDGRAPNRVELHLASVSYDGIVEDASIARPAPLNPVTLASSPSLVTDRIDSDRIIVPVRIAGRTINLQLDSGAYGIIVDRDILDALHIPTLGSNTGTTAGSYQVGRAIVPSMTFGGVTMRNVVVHSLPFAMLLDDRTPVAGLLGFDFIDAVVLHVDYEKARVEAMDPKTFVPPSNAIRIPIALDEQVPAIEASIGDATDDDFVVDTGADRSALFSAFVAAHPADVADRGLGTQILASFPFTGDFTGVGGLVSYRPVQVANFSFAGIRFDRWLFTATFAAPAFEHDLDGLIGQDVLRYFNVYFDYPQNAIYVVPNKRYAERFGP